METINDYLYDTDTPSKNVDVNCENIKLPKSFKNVIIKMCPEIRDVTSVGYREVLVYDPLNFSPFHKYLVGVDIYIDKPNINIKTKDNYESLFNDYFKMTYHDVDYVTFRVQSIILPPEKTNREKFFELFGDE